MKTPLLNRRLHSQKGTVVANCLFALGGAVVGSVVTIILVGLLAAYALPSISNAQEKSRASTANGAAYQANAQSMTPASVRESTARRNAQTLASVFAAGEAAGVEWTADDVDSAVSKVTAGGTPKSGPFAGKTFLVPSRSINDLQLAKDYLRWDRAASTLHYSATDADPTN